MTDLGKPSAGELAADDIVAEVGTSENKLEGVEKPSRRDFISTAGKTSIGLAAVAGVAACGGGGSNPESIPSSAGSDANQPPQLAAGTYTYDAAAFTLVLNLGAVTLSPNCTLADETKTIKVRALFHDFMFWRVEIQGKLYLQQWRRTSASSGATAGIAGTWVNDLGFRLVLSSAGQTSITFTGADCSTYGYLGDVAQAANVLRYGVASGDPSDTGVIIWTRVLTTATVNLTYEVSETADFAQLVAMGTVDAAAMIDYTVKVALTGLNPGSQYYYRFYSTSATDAAGQPFYSHVGRTKTLPTGSPAALKFGVASCSSFPHGFFNAYRQIARHDDLDGVFHLGDYIYDYPGVDGGENPNDYLDAAATSQGRVYSSDNQTETISLADYRARFRNYREDIDLQLVHARYSFINTWDDHETANDSYDPDGAGPEGGAENHGDAMRDEGDWEPRKAAAAQAYNEWLPITDVRNNTNAMSMGSYNDPRLHRTFRYGDLMELIVLDTRVAGRDHEPDVNSDVYDESGEATQRRMMSVEQEMFMNARLDAAVNDGIRWKMLGQQVMMGHLVGPPLLAGPTQSPTADQQWNTVINPDQWDGYDFAREQIFRKIETDNIENFVVLTGDIHTSWAIEITDDPRKRTPPPVVGVSPTGGAAPSKRYGVEFVTPSVTSPGLPDPGGTLTSGLTTNNGHIKYVDLENRGYSIMEVTTTHTENVWYHVATILDQEDENQTIDATFRVQSGAKVFDP